VSSYQLRFAVAWLVSAGIGCTSAPVHYYTLASPPEKTLPASQLSLAIDVRVLHTPPQLNRSELMVRTGPTEVMLLENERWASPLNDEIKNALRIQLQRRLSRMTGSRPASAKLTLDIDVQQLEAAFGQYALLQASWSATLTVPGLRSDGAQATACTFQADEKIHTGYAEIVEGYQRAIAALADAIVAALTSSASGSSEASCLGPIGGSLGAPGSKDH
jgi:uncharacterized lipoprotein YmbA